MATISIQKPGLVGMPEQVRFTTVAVNTTGTAFERNDIVTVSGTGADLMEVSASNVSSIALAVEPSSDAYYEPIPSGTTAHGDRENTKEVARLGENIEVEMNVDDTISQSNIGTAYDLQFDANAGTVTVDLGSTANAAFRILRLADPVHRGELGDSNARVVGVVLDSVAF